ncbi:MAG: response regulator, partial [Terriglobia bacterium]
DYERLERRNIRKRAVIAMPGEENMTAIRILIADDHELLRRGIRMLLDSHPGWEVCGEAMDGLDCLEKTKELMPDLVVVDMTMPGIDGLEATRRIRSEAPAVNVLMLSQYESSQMLCAALSAGARGFVSKMDASRDLVKAIETILAGAPPQEHV